MANQWDAEDKANIAAYDTLTKEHGQGYRAADWGSEESQQLRFRILHEIGIKPDSTVLDVGCGTGDFYTWLKQQGHTGQYTGTDITPSMVSAAKEQNPEAEFLTGDFETVIKSKYDYILASGIFAKRPQGGQEYFESMVTRMFAHSDKGVAVNSLSSWAQDKEADEFYADPLKALAFCKTLTQWVCLRSDYHNRDFTLYLYKSRQA